MFLMWCHCLHFSCKYCPRCMCWYCLAPWQKMVLSLIHRVLLFYLYYQFYSRYGSPVHSKNCCTILYPQGCYSFRRESSFCFYVIGTYVGFYWSWELIFLALLYVGGTYARLVYTWYKTILRDFSTDSLSCFKQNIYMIKKTKTRQRQDREEKVLLLATW